MIKDGSGWDASQFCDSWTAFGPWGLDDLNELVNFYFQLSRESTAAAGHAGLVLWFLHPRKGCSRGVEIKRIEEAEIPEVVAYLQQAAKRNAERFSALK